MMIPNCRVCGLSSYGAIQMPVWKKNRRGKVMTNILGEPVLDYYELWYYCEDHYEIFGATNKMLNGVIAGLDKLIEKKIQDRYDAINALFPLSEVKPQ